MLTNNHWDYKLWWLRHQLSQWDNLLNMNEMCCLGWAMLKVVSLNLFSKYMFLGSVLPPFLTRSVCLWRKENSQELHVAVRRQAHCHLWPRYKFNETSPNTLRQLLRPRHKFLSFTLVCLLHYIALQFLFQCHISKILISGANIWKDTL